MVQTWDWLFLYLPRDEEKQRIVLKNMETQKYKEVQIKDFILRFDFVEAYIYCDCTDDYDFKHKVIPGRVSFEFVKKYLAKASWEDIDATQLKLLI